MSLTETLLLVLVALTLVTDISAALLLWILKRHFSPGLPAWASVLDEENFSIGPEEVAQMKAQYENSLSAAKERIGRLKEQLATAQGVAGPVDVIRIKVLETALEDAQFDLVEIEGQGPPTLESLTADPWMIGIPPIPSSARRRKKRRAQGAVATY